MNLPMKISYLYAGKTGAILDEECKVKVVKLKDEKLIIFNNGDHLMLVASNKQQDDTTVTSDLSCHTIKRVFQERWKRKCTYSFLAFKDIIIDFCLDYEKNGYVLTGNGVISYINNEVISRCTVSSTVEMELGKQNEDDFEDLLLTNRKNESSSKVSFGERIPSDMVYTFFTEPGAVAISIENSSFHVLFENGSNLDLLIGKIQFSDGLPEIKGKITIRILQDIPHRKAFNFPLLHLVSCDVNSHHVMVSQTLYTQVFHSDVFCSTCILSLTNGCVYHVRLSSPIAKLKMICDLKQPVRYLSVLSIKEAKCDTAMDSVYQAQSQSQIEASIESFREKAMDGNCLLMVGKLGKLFFLLSDHGMTELKKTVYEYQLPSPLAACTTNKDLLFISDLKLIFAYKVLLIAKVEKEFTNNRESVKKLEFIPQHTLMYTIPIADIINIIILETNPLAICCINKKKKVIRVKCEVPCKALKACAPGHNINDLINKLEDTHAALTELKAKSKIMNNIIRGLSIVTSISHNIIKQGHSLDDQGNGISFGVLGHSCGMKSHLHGGNRFVDFSFQYHHINHNVENKLLVHGEMRNSMSFSFIGDWSISIKCFPNTSQTSGVAASCRMECFNFSVLNPNTSFQFSFFLHSSLHFCTEIKLEVYINFSFESLIGNDCQVNRNGISMYVGSHIINVIDMCRIEENVKDATLTAITNSTNPTSSTTFLECCLTKNSFLYLSKIKNILQLYFLIPTNRIKHLQKACKVYFKTPYLRDSVAKLLFKFLLCEQYPGEASVCMLSFIHLNGMKFEITVEETAENGGGFILKVAALSIHLLAALHLYIFSKLKDFILDGKEFKELFESKLGKLKEMSQLYEDMDEKVEKFDDDDASIQKGTMLKIYETFLLLRNCFW